MYVEVVASQSSVVFSETHCIHRKRWLNKTFTCSRSIK